MTSEPNRRIKFAYHLNGWSYEQGNRLVLTKQGTKITPSEYTVDMEGKIFCPACYTNLSRTPKSKDHFSNGRDAYFAHMNSYVNVKCDLRSRKPEGKRFETYEEAMRAIDDENLVIVSGFLKTRPALSGDKAGEYDETPVEDARGPLSEVPIARHTGAAFQLPSKATTVLGICRNFHQSLYKYYHFPGKTYAARLVDLLQDVRKVVSEDDEPKLYYGITRRSYNAGKTPSNIRMTELACSPVVRDFYFKAIDMEAQEKGLHDDTCDRILVMYGTVTKSGIGLAIEGLGWGEYALLPKKYNNLLLDGA